MTNSQEAALIQQHDEPNHERVRSLRDEGYSRQEAEEIDSLERRECVLLTIGARGELDDEGCDELARVQQHLHALVGNNNETFAGTAFPDHAGDGHAGSAPALDVKRHPCPQCGGEGSATFSHARGTDTAVCPWCKGAGTLTPPRVDLPYLRIKSAIPLAGGVWRVSYEVRCFSTQSDGYWRLQGPIVKGRRSIYAALWDAHEEAARRFQAEAQAYKERKAKRDAHGKRLHEEARRDYERHRAHVEARGDDWEVYAGIRR